MKIPGRTRTPTVIQMEAVECGAAALGMILGYYGRHVPLEELRVRCGISRNGSKANYLLKAARGFGLTCAGFRMDIDDLKKRGMPCIVFWKFGHFVVLEGFGKNRVYLNDPATGPRWVTEPEFSDGFTGVVLTFAKGPEFTPGGSRTNFTAALLSRLKGSGSGLLYVILAGLALAIVSILEPALRQLFIDSYIVAGIREWVPPLILSIAGVAAIAAILAKLELSHILRLHMKLAITESSRFFWHVLRLPIQFYSQRYSGEISSRTGLNESLASLLSGEMATTAITICTLIFNLAMLWSYSSTLTLVGLGVSVLNLVVLRLISRSRVDRNMRAMQETGKLAASTAAGLSMMETIKSSGMEDSFFARFGGLHAASLSTGQSMGTMNTILGAAPVLLGQLNSMVMLCWGALLALRGEMSVGMLAAFLSLMSAFVAPFGRLVQLGGSIQDAQGMMGRIEDVLKAPLDPVFAFNGKTGAAITRGSAQTGGLPPDAAKSIGAQLEGSLRIDSVSFGYSRLEEPFIRNFSLELQPGQRVALVGGSGSGKTTIANLVCGLYEPWEGTISFDGIPRNSVPREVLVSSVSRVSQEIHLFEGSCSDNISMWDDTIPETWIQKAAEDACIAPLIASRKGGFASIVAEGGRNFSGGERQRMEIARALATNPRILILDEATSALDPVTEAEIDLNLRRRGCTCLIVAHRLSTIRDCDEILVMDKGMIAERGTHAQLMALGGRYAELIHE